MEDMGPIWLATYHLVLPFSGFLDLALNPWAIPNLWDPWGADGGFRRRAADQLQGAEQPGR